jgi:hypothetical protein
LRITDSPRRTKSRARSKWALNIQMPSRTAQCTDNRRKPLQWMASAVVNVLVKN